MRREHLYSGELSLTTEDVDKMKAVFRNHLIIYNKALNELYKDRDIDMRSYLNRMNKEIKSSKYTPVLSNAIGNEIYYQWRKFNRNFRSKKQLTDIQYITLTGSSYVNEDFEVSEDGKFITLKEIGVVLELDGHLPEPESDMELLYFNVSYSSLEDGFRLTVYGLLSRSEEEVAV